MRAEQAGVCGQCGRRYERGADVRVEQQTGKTCHRRCVQGSRRERPPLPGER